MAKTLFGRRGTHFAGHVPPERLVAPGCTRLSPPEGWRVRLHLAACAVCRQRRHSLQDAQTAAVLAAYSAACAPSEEALPQAPRDAFARWLAAQPVSLPAVQQTRAGRFRAALQSSLHPFALCSRLWPGSAAFFPALATPLVLSFAAAACLLIWPHARPVQPTPENLLARAAKLDTPDGSAAPGVIRQRVLVRAGTHAFARTLYRDREGARPARAAGWQAGENPLGSAAAEAGLDWARPISASDYQAWRARQRVATEGVSHSAQLITLTTAVAEGVVSAESLTLRESDLHAVARTVELRGRGRVEIAELDYAVLPWSSVPASAFETQPPPAPLRVLRTASLPPASPALPSADQLDAAELAARLILNQLHADTGEQIEVRRTPEWVEVAGMVEEDERKRQLRLALASVPRLKVALVSASEARNAAPAAASPGVGAPAAAASVDLPDHPSPLESYLATLGRDVSARNALARQLFAGTLSISQECKALAELDARFSHPEHMEPLKAATLAELRYSHHQRLQASLREQRLLFGLLGSPDAGAAATVAGAPGTRSLQTSAEENLALARELTGTNAPAPRAATQIMREMQARLDELNAASQWSARAGVAGVPLRSESTKEPPQ